MTTTEPALVHDVHWRLDYKIRLGRAWSRFMRGLQNQELLASRCASCERTFVPPQSYCESCFAAVEEWLAVDPVGTLNASTIVYQGFEGGPEAPYAVGAIAIDGTDTLLMHFIGGVDLTSQDEARAALRAGTRVRAVWAEERTGAITDIEHFEIVRDGA
jgi:uncharacterized OB-fold protein